MTITMMIAADPDQIHDRDHGRAVDTTVTETIIVAAAATAAADINGGGKVNVNHA